MNYTAKIYKNGRMVLIIRTHKIRRFLKKTRLINFTNEGVKAYLKVDYGRFLDVWGKKTLFYNDGTYDNKQEFWEVFNAFTED